MLILFHNNKWATTLTSTIKIILTASKTKEKSTPVKLNIKMKIYLRKMMNKMMKVLCTRNTMKTKMISTTTTLKWPTICPLMKEATLKTKKESTRDMRTTGLIKMRTLKITMITNTRMEIWTMSKVFMKNLEKEAEVKNTNK